MRSQDPHALLRQFKEALAQRLWAMPTVSESEKELVFKQFLTDLDGFESQVAEFYETLKTTEKKSEEENDLLRSLLGIPGDELKSRALSLTQELGSLKSLSEDLQDELAGGRDQLSSAQTENGVLRKRIVDLESHMEQNHLDHVRTRESDIRNFSETHQSLKTQVVDLESRIGNLRALFAESNEKLLTEKQEEVSLLQKKLLDEMEAALKKKQQLSWAEEEMFAKGVAQRVRSVLVSAQGQLHLSLERLGLLDPETKSESFWKARFKIFMEGAEEFGQNFRDLQTQLKDVTDSLDSYLHLTQQREFVREPVSLVDIVKREMADLYLDRRPTLAVEFLLDDPMPDVTGDGELIRFAVRALIENAVEALPNGSGRVVMALRNRADQGRVEFSVQDSGAGIPPHMTPRLFQPFFTTKQNHQGMSLSRAKRFVELHGGTLDLADSSEKGSLFQMHLRLDGGRR